MKISWPWRKKKPLSLSEEQVETTARNFIKGHGQRVIPRPHPLNARGDFYVENTECITCGWPHVAAPDLMEWERDDESREAHCYFKKQPETQYEIEQALKAIEGSCCGALRYRGSDPEIIKKLRDARCGNAIDRR